MKVQPVILLHGNKTVRIPTQAEAVEGDLNNKWGN